MKKTIILLAVVVALMSCSKDEQAAKESLPDRDVARVTAASGLNMRAEPAMNAPVLFVIPERTLVPVLDYAGDPFTVEDKSGRWAKVNFNNASGWVFSGFLESTTAAMQTETAQEDDTPASGSRPNWQFSAAGLGPIRLGQPLPDAVIAALGQPDTHTPAGDAPDSGAYFWKHTGGGEIGLLIKLHDGVSPENVYAVYSEFAQFRTDKGIGIGSTMQQVRQAYPDGEAGYDEYYDSDVYNTGNMQFRFYRDTVDMIYVSSRQ